MEEFGTAWRGVHTAGLRLCRDLSTVVPLGDNHW